MRQRHHQNSHEVDLSAETFRSPLVKDAIHFSSRSEAALAILMEKYIPGWECIPGQTFQIQVGKKNIDFKVGDTYVEFHPIVLSHEFISQNSYHDFSAAMRMLKRRGLVQEMITIEETLKEEFAAQYWKKRKDIIVAETGEACHLVVAHSAEDFYDRVIRRMGARFPSCAEFCQEFKKFVKSF